MRAPMRTAYARLGGRYPSMVLVGIVSLSHLVALGGVGLLRLYQDMNAGQLWLIVAIVEAILLVDTVLTVRDLRALLAPAGPWLAGERTAPATVDAWRALVGLPRQLPRRRLLSLLIIVPMAAAIALVLRLPWYAGFLVLVGSAVVLLYGVVLRFFAMELALRPVLVDVAAGLPDGAALAAPTIPLRWKVLAGLPAVNIITGVLVAGLSAGGAQSIDDLGPDVLVAILVAFTVSLELTLLMARSIIEPVDDLRRATDRVAAGDLGARVPVISTDETGLLAGSFNVMVAGLQERETLREALGTYVDPEVAERVLAEGATITGEEVDVTVLFVDIRDFTAFAERASATVVVAELNRFYDLVVPVLARHGAHANKFVGDGLLGVVGAPDRVADHADRGVATALDIVDTVRRAYGDGLRIGVGVSSGPVVAGTIGGGGHLEFTVIGDAVNTAARVEALTRETGDDVLVTDATRQRLRRDPDGWMARPPVVLKGKLERVRLWAPAAGPVAATTRGADGAAAARDAGG